MWGWLGPSLALPSSPQNPDGMGHFLWGDLHGPPPPKIHDLNPMVLASILGWSWGLAGPLGCCYGTAKVLDFNAKNKIFSIQF